ncbi:hypothetical protein [Vibrio phage vB_VibM_83AMN]|nr:hypothetical protein [Vibrio phage vB_VibM_83AMN]
MGNYDLIRETVVIIRKQFNQGVLTFEEAMNYLAIKYEIKCDDTESNSIKIGNIYTHRNGNTYLVFGFANVEALPANRDKYPITVLYMGANGNVWCKPIVSFLKSMKPGGDFSFNDGVPHDILKKD